MKKILLVGIIFFFSSFGAHSYEGSGFIEYNEETGISKCEEFCFIKIGRIDEIDQINIEGIFTGTGSFGLALPINDQLQSVFQESLSGNKTIDKEIPLSQIKKQITGVEVYVYHQGNIHSESFYEAIDFSFLDKIKLGVFSVETFAPYSINLRYGKTYGNTSIIYIFYVLFVIIIAVGILKAGFSKRYIFGVSIVLYTIIASINFISFYSLYKTTSISYSQEKEYHNLGDYFSFTEKVHEEIGLSNSNQEGGQCTYYSECFSHWPYCYYWKALYMKPCKYTENKDEADYILLYKKEIPEYLEGREILYSRDNNYLLK